jgi:hypothetical protein
LKSLFDLAFDKDIYVDMVVNSDFRALKFRRGLGGETEAILFQCALNFRSIPKGINDFFVSWMMNFEKEIMSLIVIGSGAVLWTIWESRNATCFNNKMIYDPPDVFSCCFWLDS